MDAAYIFAKDLVSAKYEDLPHDVVEATKKHLLDFLGVALAGSTKPGIRELLEIVVDWGGKEESSVLGYGHKVPAPNAAQVNASMGHALDYDDIGAGGHSSVVVMPTCIAMAERKGHVSGQEFIASVTLGVEMMCRMGSALKLGQKTRPESGQPGAGEPYGGWHSTPLYGFIAAAGIAGRMLELDEEGIINALGIAYHQCSGNGQCVIEGALTKRMGPGFASRGGIMAALMAQKGITGVKNCLEGKDGLFNLYHRGEYAASALRVGLTEHFDSLNVSIKPFPCCAGTHHHINAALQLVKKYDIQAQNLREITIFDNDPNNVLLFPLELRSHPQKTVDSQFSIPWGVAVAILRKQVTMGDFTEEAIKNRDILEVSDKIRAEVDPTLIEGGGSAIAKVKVITEGGESYFEQVGGPLGGFSAPLSFNECAVKFKDCASYSVKKLSERDINQVIDMVRRLETLVDVREIIEILS
jgi:2-methylcitrate dehydratase PrpD